MIKVLDYEQKAVGKRIKNTKIRYRWVFQLKNKEPYTVTLFESIKSRKRRVFIDGVQKTEQTLPKGVEIFQFACMFKGLKISVAKLGSKYELHVNNIVFSNLWMKRRMKNEFNYEDHSKKYKPDSSDEDKREPGHYQKKSYKKSKSKLKKAVNKITIGGTLSGGYNKQFDGGKKKRKNSHKRREEQNQFEDQGALGFSNDFEKFSFRDPDQQEEKKQKKRKKKDKKHNKHNPHNHSDSDDREQRKQRKKKKHKKKTQLDWGAFEEPDQNNNNQGTFQNQGFEDFNFGNTNENSQKMNTNNVELFDFDNFNTGNQQEHTEEQKVEDNNNNNNNEEELNLFDIEQAQEADFFNDILSDPQQQVNKQNTNTNNYQNQNQMQNQPQIKANADVFDLIDF